jgi:drug/metabolite transporter (DMT)-like permease
MSAAFPLKPGLSGNASMSDAPAHAAQRPLLGIILITCAVAMFASVDAMTKHLATSWNVPLVVAARYAVNVLALAVIYAPQHGRALIATNRTGLVMVRGLCLAAGSLFAGLALTRMPVAETISIIFLAPFAVMILAIPLLGEKVTPLGWVAALSGFAGVLLVANPGNGLDTLGVIYALICAAVTVGYYLLSRLLAKTESTMAMLFHTALVGAVLFGAYLPWSLEGPMPQGVDLALFAAFGLAATLGHYLFTAAFRVAPASVLAPVNYVHIAFAALVGWLVFGDVPSATSFAGMTLVVSAGVTSALVSNRKKPAVVEIGETA